MSFKENLLKKIEIDTISGKIVTSVGPPGSQYKVDKAAVRSLLAMSHYELIRERDMDLYALETASDKKRILVLDNDLPIYHTTVADVALRKSPTVKEMVSIRNAIKILNDSDVLVSKKAESVRALQQECIALLDLSFGPADLEEIAGEGFAALENGYADGVIEALTLFAELLGYVTAPKAFSLPHYKIMGQSARKAGGEIIFGPAVLYSLAHNTLKLVRDPLSSLKKEHIARLKAVAAGEADAGGEGQEVFDFLKNAVRIGGSDS